MNTNRKKSFYQLFSFPRSFLAHSLRLRASEELSRPQISSASEVHNSKIGSVHVEKWHAGIPHGGPRVAPDPGQCANPYWFNYEPAEGGLGFDGTVQALAAPRANRDRSTISWPPTP